MKASISTGDGHVEVSDIPVPHPGPGQILVKVVCAALNPPEGKLTPQTIWTGLTRVAV